MVEKEQVRPLATAAVFDNSIGGDIDEERAKGWRSAQYLRKRRGILCCCGCCGLTVVVLGLVVLILALTVFKVKDPILTMNSIHVDGINVDAGTSIDHPVSVNATLTADISIKNPNVASFEFDNSTTEFYYRGETVGVAYAPDGRVSADRTVRMNVTVDVLADRVAMQPNASDDVLAGSVNLTSYTEITGRVNVVSVFKRYLDIMLNCSMTLDLSLSQQEIKNQVCQVNIL